MTDHDEIIEEAINVLTQEQRKYPMSSEVIADYIHVKKGNEIVIDEQWSVTLWITLEQHEQEIATLKEELKRVRG